jgi:hypothetical protein
MKDVYLDFGGWLKLHPNTCMQYIGDDERFDPIITVAVWLSLPPENRGEYILEDFVAAMRDGEDIEFNELTITFSAATKVAKV